MKKLIALVLVLICILGLIGCNASGEMNFTRIEDLEQWITEEWSLIADFKILCIKVVTMDSPKHENNYLIIKSSYMHNGEFNLRTFTFEITYDEFLTLYDNNEGHIVYNIEEENGNIVTSINSKSLNILKKAFEWNWRTYR